MAGLFRKRQFKPWIASSVISKDKNLKSRVVKVLCRRSKSAQGSVVMLVSDGELSISAIFSEEVVDNALSNLGLGRDSSWDTALLILHEFTLELKMNPGQQDVGEFVLYVEKFNIWDLQPGYHAKFDVKYCMEHIKVREMMIEEIRDMKERAACQSQSNKTGSIALTQLLDEMAKPSESFSQSGCDEKEEDSANFTANKCVPLTESLMEKLIQPFTVEEFLIPPSQAAILQNIPEWKPDYQPPSSVELEEHLLTVIDQQFDVCAANTLCSPPENVKERSSREASQDVIYLGISVTPPEHPDTEEAKSGRRSPCPVNVLFKHSNMDSQSQGTSSQWQEEVDSVRFSFEEELCTTATPESQEKSQSQVHVGTSDRLCKHVETVEKSSKQVAKETDGVKDCRALSGASLEKDSCTFVTEEILKEKSCSAVSEKGLERTGASSIKETEVVKTAISVTKRVEKLGMSLNQASAEKRSGKLESKKNKKEIDDLHLTKECGEERNHTVVTKGISEKEGDQIVTKEMKKENADALVTKEYGEARDSTVVTKIILEKQVDNCVTKGKEKDALLTKEYSEESLDLGSPNAQSTQINEVEDISTKGTHRNIAEKVEELLDNTEENENDFQKRTKTNYSEIESVSQSLLLVESADNVLESQDNNNLKMYQRNVTHITAVNVDSSVLVKDENVDSEYEAKIDTSQGNASNSSLSDADKSIMLNYYSQNSSSPSHSWNNVLLRLAEKKKRLEALKYITNRISITIDEHDKEEDTETEKTWNNESFYGYIKEEIIRDVNDLCSDVGKSEESFNSYIKAEVIRDVNDLCSDAGRSEEPAYKDTEGRLVMVGEDSSKSNNENLSNQTENVTKGDSGDNKVLEGGDEDFLGFEDVGTLCGESKGILEETYNGDQSEMDTVDTTDTGYPIASLTLQESIEENGSCLLPSDNVLEQTDLEAVNRIHCKNIAKYTKAHTREETDQDSDQSDIEIIGHSHSHQRCTSYMKKETNAVSKEITSMKGVLNPCGKIKQETLNHNPLAPLYFETESGSTRRSKRLYAKVISCRQKDSLINSANMENSSAVSSRINDNSENSRKKIIESGAVLVDDGVVVERQISKQQDKQTDCVSNPNAESNLDANKETVVATEPVCEEEANKKSAKKTVNEDCSVQKYISLKSQSNANFTSLRTGQVKDTYNADSSKQKATVWTRINENILKNVSETTDTKWNFKKDIRIMLERCDQQENNYMKGNKRRRLSSFGSCHKLSKSGNALQKPLVDGNQLKRPSVSEKVLSVEKASEKPVEGSNSLLKTKVKSGKVFRKESAETVCSMAVNFHCACCGSEEKIETGSVQQDCDKTVNLLRTSDKSSVSIFSFISSPSLKLSVKKIQGEYKVVSDRDGKRNGHVSDSKVGPQYSDTEDRVTGTKKGKEKLKRKKAGLKIVSDISKDSEIIANSTSDSSTESEIIAYSTAVVKFENKAEEKRDQVLEKSNKIEITELSDSADSDSEETGLISVAYGSIDEGKMNKDKSDKSDIYLETSKEVRADTNKELVSERISACSFEDQFKNWIKKGNVNSETERNENMDCQNSQIFAGHSVESDKECQKTENKKNASGKDSSTEMENCEENMPTDSFQATASQPGGDIFVTKESSQKDSGLQLCDQVSLTSPVLCTQPFEICPYPQTQEFVPKLSETLVQTPLLESLTACNNESLSKSNISKDSDIPQTQEFLPQLSESLVQTSMLESLTCPNESVNDRSTSKDSDKTSKTPFHVECNSLKEGQIETTNELEKDLTKYDLGETKKSYTSMRKSSPEKVKKSCDKQVTVPFHLGQAHKKNTGDEKENIVHSGSSVTNKTSLNDHFEHTGNSIIEATFDATLGATRETRCVSSTEDKTFTKLMKKCEPQHVSSDFWAISKPEKLAFKVKPVKRTNIHRKRKSDFNSLDNTSKIKKQKCTDSIEEYSKVVKERNETKVGLKQNNKVAESVVDTLNDSLEDFVVNKSPKKAKTSTKAVHEGTVVVGDRENKTKSTDGVKTPCKTYEPRKIFIDGHCFGNKVFWQNFIESPYSAPASGETKNKSFVEKTNKRKSRLDSSQGSQKKSSSSTVGENVEKIQHAAVNRSSESLFSGENEENEIHDLSPDSVSLLPCKKMETGVSDIVKTYADQTKLKECVKIVNESGTKSKSNSGDLIYSRVNGMLRFYRQKDAEHEENKDSDSGALADPQLGRYKRRNAKLDNNTDRKVFDPVCETSKQINSVNKQKERVEKAESNKIPSLDMKGSVLNEMFSIDKKLFVHDWLMKHKKIGEQESSSQELSPPEIQTPGNSLPSYQPTVSAVGQQAQNYVTDIEQSFVLHEVSAEEQQKRDNSLDDTSSSESSDSIRSEDLKKPMPAATRYLLKFRKARRERKRKKMLELKSCKKNTA